MDEWKTLACGTPPFVAKPAALLTEAGVPFEALASGDAVTTRFPYLAVPDTHAAIVDSIGGFLDPGREVTSIEKQHSPDVESTN